MSLDYQVTKPTDLTKINTNDYGELMWWSYILLVSPEKILTTIEKIGNSSEQVRKSFSS
ncbi:MAG: hypothetical protein JWR18_2772 [Segetibacter sp.]|jgi:hypothetical protein|nr:hypothetical protein [Segetibacter sp.]